MYDLLGKLQPQDTVLDLGCGSGTGSFRYETCRGTIVAMDLALNDKTLRRNDPHVAYMSADSAAIPLADGSVRGVISHHTMEHFQNYRGALSEIARVLRPDGWLWVAVPNGYGFDDTLYRLVFSGGGHVNRFSHDSLVEEIQRRTEARLIAQCDLFSSFIYLKKPSEDERQHYPRTARLLAVVPDGLSTLGILVLNAVTRMVDKALGSRCSQYGWGFVFSRDPLDTPTPPTYFNVCRNCGSGIPFKSMGRGTVLGIGLDNCPHCKELNVFVKPPGNLE